MDAKANPRVCVKPSVRRQQKLELTKKMASKDGCRAQEARMPTERHSHPKVAGGLFVASK